MRHGLGRIHPVQPEAVERTGIIRQNGPQRLWPSSSGLTAVPIGSPEAKRAHHSAKQPGQIEQHRDCETTGEPPRFADDVELCGDARLGLLAPPPAHQHHNHHLLAFISLRRPEVNKYTGPLNKYTLFSIEFSHF